MTKEEKLKLVKKLYTQIDGVEAYIRQLNEAEVSDSEWYLYSAESTLSVLRKEIQCYEVVELNRT